MLFDFAKVDGDCKNYLGGRDYTQDGRARHNEATSPIAKLRSAIQIAFEHVIRIRDCCRLANEMRCKNRAQGRSRQAVWTNNSIACATISWLIVVRNLVESYVLYQYPWPQQNRHHKTLPCIVHSTQSVASPSANPIDEINALVESSIRVDWKWDQIVVWYYVPTNENGVNS